MNITNSDRPAVGIHISLNRSYGPSRRQRLDVFLPEVDTQRPLVACVPGGWWQGTTARQQLRVLALHLAERGYPAACLGHRLFDEVPDGRPMRKDLLEAIRLARQECGLCGQEVSRVVLLGQGSGALSALACLQATAVDDALLEGAALIGSPPGQQDWPDCPTKPAQQRRRFFGASQELDPLALAATEPELLLIHGEDDDLVPLAATQAWSQQLAAAGARVQFQVLRHADQQIFDDVCGVDAEAVLELFDKWVDGLTDGHHGEPVIGETGLAQRLERKYQCDDEL
jgi:acetyl esterase/lipase